jgi:CPA2 family monovalent cation:H+ antiporter-2
MHDLGLIVTLATALLAALVLGYATLRLGVSPILGYLLAGIAVGPHTPGFVADARLASQLAEIGVVLLMFGVGLHFHPKDLLAVKGVAIPGALGQSLVATGLGAALALAFGWTLGAGLVLGVAVSVASTVVLIRGLSESGRLDEPAGHVAVGWLVAEDVFTIVVLVLLPAFAGGTGGGSALGQVAGALGRLALLVALVLLAGARVIPWILGHVARTRSRELFTLTVLAVALAVATVSATTFGVSMALGAFLAGMVVGQSDVAHQAAADALPLRDAFAVLFFVSVGMLFDPAFVLREPWLVLGTLGIVLVAKPLAALVLVSAFRYSARTALTVAVGLAQVGEFSFIVAELAERLDLLPAAGHNVLVAAALVSITLNPLLFRALGPLEERLRRRRGLWRLLDRRAAARGDELNLRARAPDPPGKSRAVVVGYGPVGRTVTRILRDFDVVPVVVDLNVDTVARLVEEGHLAVYGDAARPEVLAAAGVRQARYLVVTLPDLASRLPVILAAREIHPSIRVLVRARYLQERSMLEDVGATAVAYEEAEAAVALAEFVLREIGVPEERREREADRIRKELEIRPERAP